MSLLRARASEPGSAGIPGVEARSWALWRRYFEGNRQRADPQGREYRTAVPPGAVAAIAQSLARFQLGEAGGGRIATQIYRARLRGIDDDYRAALGLFVAEEGRHARMLARIVPDLGGTLLTAHWTSSGFTHLRRLLGVRLKLMVLLAAEIIGLAFYGLVASSVGEGPLRTELQSICGDEAAHLRFHADFIASQSRPWRALLLAAFLAITLVALGAVLVDHAPTFKALRWSPRFFVRRVAALTRAACRRAMAVG